MNNIKPIAIYLPQYHPIPENDAWWGKGFTEWTNVAKAKPLYKGHEQPKLPAALGFYDLRVPEVREEQAAMAKAHGIYGFCYYHYWFGNGQELLERPFNEVLKSGKPDFPFMLCWANQTWSGIWFGETDKILMEQQYPGRADIEKHFYHLLPAFKDERYIKVDGKPFFVVYDVPDLPDSEEFAQIFNELAVENGLPGIHLVGGNIFTDNWDAAGGGFNAKISNSFNAAITKVESKQVSLVDRALSRAGINKLKVLDHADVVKEMIFVNNKNNYPIVVPNWDNTPRTGVRGYVFNNSTPELFAMQLKKASESLNNIRDEEKFIFIKSWNEWAEGNYLEPDTKYGYKFLEEVKKLVGDN